MVEIDSIFVGRFELVGEIDVVKWCVFCEVEVFVDIWLGM